MKRSTERILTTHVGSLPRPDDLIRTMFAKQEGVPVDAVALEERTRAAVAEVVAQQVARRRRRRLRRRDEQALVRHLHLRPVGRVRRHVAAADRTPTWSTSRTCRRRSSAIPGARAAARPPATRRSPCATRRPRAVDVEHLQAALPDGQEAFLNAASPGVIALFFRNDHYATREEYVFAIAEAMRVEYEAVTEGRRVGADRLPGPGDGAPHPVRGSRSRRVPARGAAQHRGAQPRHAQHRPRAAAHARLLGQLRGPAPLRRAASRHRRPRLHRAPGRDRLRGRQPAPRARVADLRGRRGCPRARS